MTEKELYEAIQRGDQRMIGEKERGLYSAMPALMRKVYVWMTLALVITAVAAYGVASSPNLMATIYSSSGIIWGLVIAEFILVMAISAAIHKLSLSTATLLFILYSALNGVTLSSIFVLFDVKTIGTVFLITAGMFGVTALYGYTTKRDLSSMGKILFMALIGLVIATLVNMFLRSAMFDYVLSYIGVIVFTGLTAWDTQQIKRMLQTQYDMSEGAQKLALLGALTLYLDFINLFLYLLRIFGNRE